jgi:hypothetical protein
MPFESLSCPRCGSANAQEVKPGTYFCNHCDNVYRYVSPGRGGPSGGCELLVEARLCGVPAIGSCRTCQRAFCRTHQARATGGIENLLASEFSAPAAARNGYIDWCEDCRSAELDKVDGKDEPALKQPLGEFLDEQFLLCEDAARIGVSTPEVRSVLDLVAAADQALREYPCETAATVPTIVRENWQLFQHHIVDRSAFKEGERITRIKRQGGALFYIYDSQWHGIRVSGTYTNVWTPGRSKMLVAKCSRFKHASRASDGIGYRPPLIRYTEVEEVGSSRMEGIANSLKRYFPPQSPTAERVPAEKAPATKAAKRRWFR